jgi:hypothetical protein
VAHWEHCSSDAVALGWLLPTGGRVPIASIHSATFGGHLDIAGFFKLVQQILLFHQFARVMFARYLPIRGFPNRNSM